MCFYFYLLDDKSVFDKFKEQLFIETDKAATSSRIFHIRGFSVLSAIKILIKISKTKNKKKQVSLASIDM